MVRHSPENARDPVGSSAPHAAGIAHTDTAAAMTHLPIRAIIALAPNLLPDLANMPHAGPMITQNKWGHDEPACSFIATTNPSRPPLWFESAFGDSAIFFAFLLPSRRARAILRRDEPR